MRHRDESAWIIIAMSFVPVLVIEGTEIDDSLLELISSESSPTADLGPDLRPDRGRPTQRG
jgi:hypothetical protein